MPSPKKVTTTDAKAGLHQDLLKSVQQMRSGKAVRAARAVASPVLSARRGCDLSQADFAELLGISVRTLQKWEQGEREPSGAAKSLILIAQKHPKILVETISQSANSVRTVNKAAVLNTGSNQISHIEHISSETTRQAYRYIVKHAQLLREFRCTEHRQGALRLFNYWFGDSRLYGLIVNKASLLFYILKGGLTAQPGITEKFNTNGIQFNVPRPGEITVRITSTSEAKTLLDLLFPFNTDFATYLTEKNK